MILAFSALDVKEWLGLAASFLTLVVLMLKFMSISFKNVKMARWAKVGEQIQGYVKIAEDYINFEGKDKKLWVLTQAQQYCLDHKIKFDEDLASQIIESYVDLSRQVNKREDK